MTTWVSTLVPFFNFFFILWCILDIIKSVLLLNIFELFALKVGSYDGAAKLKKCFGIDVIGSFK